MIKKTLFLSIVLYCFFCGWAQNEQNNYEQEWLWFDNYLKKNRVIDAKNQLDKIEQWAIEDQKQDEQFRAQFERARIYVYFNENKLPDAIFYLDSLLQTAQPPYSNIFNFLIAECLSAYIIDNFRVINERTQLANNNLQELENWSSLSFTQAINNYLFKALTQLETTATMKSENFDFLLSKNEGFRSIRPTLFDVITQFFLESIISSSSNTHFRELLQEHPHLLQPCPEFLAIDLDSITNNSNLNAKVFFTLLQNVFRYYKNQIVPSTDVLIDYELLKLNYLIKCLGDNDLGEDSQYFKILETLDSQYKNTDGYDAIQYHKALFYFELAKKTKMGDAKTYLQRSKALFDELSLNSSGFYGKNALHYLGILNEKVLEGRGKETYYTSAQNLLVPITYKNLDSIYISIYKIEPTEFWNNNFSPSGKRKNIDSLFFDFITSNENAKYIRTELIYLVNPYDFKSHSTDILLQNMKPGNYYLIFHLAQEPEEKNILTCIRTIATQTKINILNNNRQCHFTAVNNQTGKPLPKVKLIFSKKIFDFWEANSSKKTNSKGNVLLNKGNSIYERHFLVNNGEDSYRAGYYLSPAGRNSNFTGIWNSRNIELFTDRAIYRPGQTVYLKAIYYGNYKILKNKELQVEFKDPNGQSIKKYILKTNNFGSVDTYFQIPANGKTGNFTIFAKASKSSLSYQNIKVEEYKRPNFEIEFEKLQKEYRLGDSVEITGYAKTYSGAVLSNATVKYSIYSNDEQIETISDEIVTERNGKFTITYEAKTPTELTAKWIRYSVKIDVTDANGETQSKEKSFTLYKNTIRFYYCIENINLFHRKYLEDKTYSVKVIVYNTDRNEISCTVSAKIEQLQFPEKVFHNFNTSQPDKPILSQAEYKTFFPHLSYEKPDVKPNRWKVVKTVFTQTFNSLEDSLRISGFTAWTPGMYRIILTTLDRNNDLVTDTSYFNVFNVTDTNPSVYRAVNLHLSSKYAQTGETLKIGVSSMLKDAWVHCIVQKNNRLKKTFWVNLNQEQKVIAYKVRKTDRGYLRVYATATQNGETFQAEEKASIYKPEKKISKHKLKRQYSSLNIETEHINNPLSPGEKESWRFKISNLYSKQRAEILALMYDYSLDIFAPHTFPDFRYSFRIRKYMYQSGFDFLSPNLLKDNLYFNKKSLPVFFPKTYETVSLFHRNNNYVRYKSLMLNCLKNEWGGTQSAVVPSYSRVSEMPHQGSHQGPSTIKGVVKDVSGEPLQYHQVLLKQDEKVVNMAITDDAGRYQIFGISAGMYDISTVGSISCATVYTEKGIYMYGSEVKFIDLIINCSTELNYVEVFYVPPVFSQDKTTSSQKLTGDEVRKTPGRSITATLLGGGTSVEGKMPSGFGNRNDGQQVIIDGVSRSGEERTIPFEFSQHIQIRKNFAETAFFMPKILTDKEGKFVIEFTAPEALTKWKFMALAHTKDKRAGTIQGFFQTQKTLMLMPNRPRFLRECDTMAFSVKIANLSDTLLVGKAKIEFFNALNNQTVEILLDKNTQIQDFTCAQNTVVEWRMVVPKNISAMGYKVVAQAGNYSDGEEYTLPVLPNRTLVTESLPIYVNGKSSKSFTFEKLQNHNSSTLSHFSYTLEFTANPAWYAILSLPYLMEYRYDCNEQIFSKLYANAIGTHIVNTNPKIKEVFEAWSKGDASVFDSKLTENEELKNIILEETPWFFTAQKQSERLQNIGKLFKPQRMKNEITGLVARLQLNQNANGSWGWFSGLSESQYITQHIVAGMGHLKALGVPVPECRTMLSRAKKYLDSEHLKAYEKRLKDSIPYFFNNLDAHYLYARSFDYDSTFLKQPFVQQYLEEAQKDIYKRELYTQASLALTFHRLGMRELAQDIIESIRQQAFKNEEMGMYWRTTHSGRYYSWYQAPVERQALFIEAFSEIAPNADEIEMMKLWLIKQKQTQAWSNTKATANAAYALLLHGSNLLSSRDDVTINVGSQSFNPSQMEDAEAGTGYFKTIWQADEIKPEMAQIELHKPSEGSSYGAVYWQYFEDLDKITSAQTGLSLEKQLYKIIITSIGEELQEITEDQPLKIGDKVVVRMILKTDRDLEYVHLKDLRASAFEPLNVFTATKYQSGLQYTEATRDAATNFFFTNMPKGNYVFEYRLVASQKGDFSNGIATIQCMYAPEFSAHSTGGKIRVSEN